MVDQIKTGKLIASLRRQAGLTQEALGERIGVSNKTVSRWENGNYMPDIETLQLLAKEFGVTINELLAGEKLPDAEFRERADENLVQVSRAGAFTFGERRAYFKRKWRREHIPLFVLAAVLLLAAVVLPILLDRPWFLCLAPTVALIGYAWLNNRMMRYVESALYDRK